MQNEMGRRFEGYTKYGELPMNSDAHYAVTGYVLEGHADMAPCSNSNDPDYFTSVPCLDAAETRLRFVSLFIVTANEQALWLSLAVLLEALYRPNTANQT